MFPFDNPTICLGLLIAFIIFFIVIVILLVKKYELIVIPNENVENFKNTSKKIFTKQEYKVEERKKYLYVESSSFTATKLFFKQDGANIIVHRASSSTPTADIIMVAGVLISGLIVPLIISIIIEIKSKNFAKEEIHNLLKDYKKWIKYCPWCNKEIPHDGLICPYCGKKVKGF